MQANLQISWKNGSFPPAFLTADNVLDYFCDQSNPFYDAKGSCNEMIRMQQSAFNRPLAESLLLLQGIQYVLVTAQSPLFVILKHIRHSSTQATPLTYYYIVNGTVCQSPDLYSLIQARLLGAVQPLKEALSIASSRARFNVAKGHHWQFSHEGDREGDDKQETDSKPEDKRSTLFQRTRVDRLLAALTQRFPPPLEPCVELSAPLQTTTAATAATTATTTTTASTITSSSTKAEDWKTDNPPSNSIPIISVGVSRSNLAIDPDVPTTKKTRFE